MDNMQRSIRAVAAGWATLEILARAPEYLLALVAPSLGVDESAVSSIATMIFLSIAAYVGGFVTARIAGRRQVAHALVCAAFASVTRVALAAWSAWQGVEEFTLPLMIFTVLWIVGFCGIGATYARYRGMRRPAGRTR